MVNIQRWKTVLVGERKIALCAAEITHPCPGLWEMVLMLQNRGWNCIRVDIEKYESASAQVAQRLDEKNVLEAHITLADPIHLLVEETGMGSDGIRDTYPVAVVKEDTLTWQTPGQVTEGQKLIVPSGTIWIFERAT